jgi:hypothetical protein
LGNTVAEPVGAFILQLDFLPYRYLTATATHLTDGTTEFSNVLGASMYGGVPVYLPIITNEL